MLFFYIINSFYIYGAVAKRQIRHNSSHTTGQEFLDFEEIFSKKI